jgi:DNA-binding beta-propeller fold protein YncE
MEDYKVMLHCFRTSGVAWMFLSFLMAANAASDAGSLNAPVQLSPTQSLSLKACGWEPEQPVVHHTGYIPSKLAFDHAGNLWLGYSKKMQQLVPRTTPELGWLYNVVELSGTPAKCSVRTSLPTTESSPVGILFSSNDTMLIVANDKLHAVDQNGFKERASFDLLRPSDQARYLVVQSPGRKSLVVVAQGFTKADTSYTWLDSGSLGLSHSCTYPPFPDYHHYVRLRSFADDGRFVELDYDETTHPIFWLAAGQYCSPKTPVHPEHIQPAAAIMLESETAYFRDNLLNDNVPSIVVYGRDGTLLHSIPGHDKESMSANSGVAVSEDGRRAAVLLDITSGGARWLDISNHVAARRVDIYDTATWTRIAQIKLSSKGEAELALSPDGKTLAIQTNDLVQFYDALP